MGLYRSGIGLTGLFAGGTLRRAAQDGIAPGMRETAWRG